VDEVALLPALASTAAAAAAGTSVAAAGGSNGSSDSSRSGLLPKLGQWLGLTGPSQPTATAVPGLSAGPAGLLSTSSGGRVVSNAGVGGRQSPPYQWAPVFHPSRTAAGTQPTLVIPQVRLITRVEGVWV